jgi:hypothetical protein
MNNQITDKPEFIEDNFETPERAVCFQNKLWLLMFWLLAVYGLISIASKTVEVFFK